MEKHFKQKFKVTPGLDSSIHPWLSIASFLLNRHPSTPNATANIHDTRTKQQSPLTLARDPLTPTPSTTLRRRRPP